MNQLHYTLDLRSVVDYYRTVQDLQKVYSVVTLSTLMMIILTVPGNLDDEEYLWQALEPYIVDRPDVFKDDCYQDLGFWIDDLKMSLDREIIKQSPYGVDPGESFFVQWVDSTTALMRSAICLPNPNLNFTSPTSPYVSTHSTYNRFPMSLI